MDLSLIYLIQPFDIIVFFIIKNAKYMDLIIILEYLKNLYKKNKKLSEIINQNPIQHTMISYLLI